MSLTVVCFLLESLLNSLVCLGISLEQFFSIAGYFAPLHKLTVSSDSLLSSAQLVTKYKQDVVQLQCKCWRLCMTVADNNISTHVAAK